MGFMATLFFIIISKRESVPLHITFYFLPAIIVILHLTKMTQNI